MSIEKNKINIIDIKKRVARVIGKTMNKDIAAELGISPQACSNWDKRNCIPFDRLCNFALKYKISIDWLLKGTDNYKPTHDNNSDVSHVDVIKKFNDKKWAREQNETLVIIEKKQPGGKQAVEKALDEILTGRSPYIDVQKKRFDHITPTIKKKTVA